MRESVNSHALNSIINFKCINTYIYTNKNQFSLREGLNTKTIDQKYSQCIIVNLIQNPFINRFSREFSTLHNDVSENK